jgi:hypothetical protein
MSDKINPKELKADFFNEVVNDISKKANDLIREELEIINESKRYLIYMRVINYLTVSAFKPLLKYQEDLIIKKINSTHSTIDKK